jgi:hypothetical protein
MQQPRLFTLNSYRSSVFNQFYGFMAVVLNLGPIAIGIGS